MHWVFLAACGLSLVVVSGGYSLFRSIGCVSFSSCDSPALIALRSEESSHTRGQSMSPALGGAFFILLCLQGSPLILDYCLLFNLGGEKSKQS